LNCAFTSRSTQNRSFCRRLPKPVSWLGMEKTKPNTRKTRNHQSNVLQHKINTNTKARFSRLLRHPAWKQSGFSKEKTSKGGDKQGKSEEKRISGEAYHINKQTVYMAPKSEIESRAHYAPEPARGSCRWNSVTNRRCCPARPAATSRHAGLPAPEHGQFYIWKFQLANNGRLSPSVGRWSSPTALQLR